MSTPKLEVKYGIKNHFIFSKKNFFNLILRHKMNIYFLQSVIG